MASVNTIRAMFTALRACWVPPPTDQARHGMQYTVRFALKRDGALIGPPKRTYSSHDAPAAVRDAYAKAADASIERCIFCSTPFLISATDIFKPPNLQNGASRPACE